MKKKTFLGYFYHCDGGFCFVHDVFDLFAGMKKKRTWWGAFVFCDGKRAPHHDASFGSSPMRVGKCFLKLPF